jgi:hypothetical protein
MLKSGAPILGSGVGRGLIMNAKHLAGRAGWRGFASLQGYASRLPEGTEYIATP